jgi:UDP-N-acetylglucosamine acyltransferase
MTRIHPTAIVHPHAELDPSVIVGAYSCIGPHVKIKKNTVVQAHVSIEGFTEIGEENEIFNCAQIGQAPIDLTYKGDKTKLVIGNGNTFREFSTIHPGTLKQEGLTVIGHRNLFMCYVHISHDSMIGDGNILANVTQLGGHVTIYNHCVLGASTGIHQFCRIGSYSMVGAGAMVTKDVPPYCLVAGNRAQLKGLNLIGLKRRGFRPEDLKELKEIYQSLQAGEKFFSFYTNEHAEHLRQFVENSKRGIVRPNTGSSKLQEHV